MGIAIFLRRRSNRNRFRDIIIDSINTGIGTHAIMCSGFFQETNNGYKASQERGFSRVAATNLKELKLIGVYSRTWMNSYKNFHRNLIGAKVNVQAYYNPRFRWHAKIFILKRDNYPLLAIFGSSNITRPAFSNTSPFNWESDVVLWTNKFSKSVSSISSLRIDQENDHLEIIMARYLSADNGGLSILRRIRHVENELNRLDLIELPFEG